jgi:hypothetical protein
VYAADTEAEARDADPANAEALDTGCSGFAWSQLVSIEVVGSYEDQYGGQHDISTGLWQGSSSNFHLLSFSNEDNWAVYQNDCDNDYSPGLYSRFDWTSVDSGAAGAAGAGSTLSFCQTGYDQPTPRAATDLSPADAGDLETGCNGFPWSDLASLQ